MLLITLALAGVGFLSATLVALSAFAEGDAAVLLNGLGWFLFLPFILGAFASQIAANALVSAVPRR